MIFKKPEIVKYIDVNSFENGGFLFERGETVHSRVYGVEIETNFDPAPRNLRITADLLKRKNWQCQTRTDVFNYFLSKYRDSFRFLERVYQDEGYNLEFVTRPSSLLSLQNQLHFLGDVLTNLENRGFNANSSLCGTHININTINWGNTWEIRKKNLEKFLYFCFYNQDLLNRLCKRKGFSQHKSDLTYLLDDYVGNFSIAELNQRFSNSVSYILNAWENNEFCEELNMIFNKNVLTRGVIEIKWFASSYDWKILSSFVEFIDSLILFCNTQSSLSGIYYDAYKKFLNSLIDYQNLYANLIEQLTDLEETQLI